jgi:selT/selW/selH-like putative selenoprotein
LNEEFDIDAELIEGGSSVFDVRLDGRLIYSKDETGRFPENDEIVSQIRGV